MVRAPDSRLKGRGFESLQERRKNFLLRSRLSVLTLISESVPPRVIAAAQLTAKRRIHLTYVALYEDAYTLRMWLCMKWHGAWLYGVHRISADTAAVSCGTSHANAVSIPLRWIFNTQKQQKNAL